MTSKQSVEYSSREVSPPALLLQQLRQAHRVFRLHHGSSLDALYARRPRDKFCSIISRFWTRFSRTWDVLLHGNPAADVFGGLKLSGGGELGFGVGEEECGSGERDVLEDLVKRTEGLVDLVVARFGEHETEAQGPHRVADDEESIWLGTGCEPEAADGVIFRGTGMLTSSFLRNVSIWLSQIYADGEYAYGVRDNPQREPRKRRRKAAIAQPLDAASRKNVGRRDLGSSPRPQHGARHVSELEQSRGSASQNVLTIHSGKLEASPPQQAHSAASGLASSKQPSVPPPIVSAVETALDEATSNADKTVAQDHADAMEGDPKATMGIPDAYMKYLTFGLSTLSKSTPQHPSKRSSRPKDSAFDMKSRPMIPEDGDEPALTHPDPMPDDHVLKSKHAVQRHLERQGHFLVGLKGDLDSIKESDEASLTEGSFYADNQSHRIVLRTVQVQTAPDSGEPEDFTTTGLRSPSSVRANSTDPAPKSWSRFRILIYVHRPFIYCFFFEDRTSSLSYSSFYKTLHQTLRSIHRPLLSSTSHSRIALRSDTANEQSETASISGGQMGPSQSTQQTLASMRQPVYHLIYDPKTLTIQTNLPNIPEPGTPAAEGIFSSGRSQDNPTSRAWTRIEALGVHSSVLNTLESVKKRKNEIERSCKTSKGWWIVWMKVAPSAVLPAPAPPGKGTIDIAETSAHAETHAHSAREAQDDSRIAILVRKTLDPPALSTKAVSSTAGSRAMRSMYAAMTLGLGRSRSALHEQTVGPEVGRGPAALAGGIGLDARAYVDSLLGLGA